MDPLTFRSWILLGLVVLMAVFINAPLRVKVTHRLRIPLNLVTVPPVALVVGLATTSVTWADAGHGIVGSHGVQPYSILVLLLVLAWLCTALDLTGGLSMVALAVAQRAAGSRGGGRRFFGVTYALGFVFTVLTNNDVAALTLTPMTAYFTQAMQVTPYPFLLAEFLATNIASIVFFMGNVNNIIVAEAAGMNFATYAAWMVLPAIGSFVVTGIVLFIQYRRQIPTQGDLPNVDPRAALRQPRAAGVHTTLLVGLTVALAVSSFYAIPVWLISLPFGAAAALATLLGDLWPHLRHPPPRKLEVDVASTTAHGNPAARFQRRLARYLPVTADILARLPYSIFPFTFCMFVFVQALTTHGWTPRLAWLLTQLCPDPTAAAFSVGYLSALASVVFNNIPAALFFVNAISSPEFHADRTTRRAAYLAVAIGTDLGAHLTIPASLAGLLWSSLAGAKGIHFGSLRFIRSCAWSFPLTVASACGILAAEVAVMARR
ncbi:hypothetical protein IWQ60_012113 [Tieghemiomyces parasiticus]|uniref:Citrate transporter-like domain-containing protein n=1 Tax=Tieghemiomyces parasiticus TaxID=78921 RepID=A0A9W8DLN6_9FUNG|nr:hypothetical protein IWQ60_012113 [Tieghemiomyces parasiticus]